MKPWPVSQFIAPACVQSPYSTRRCQRRAISPWAPEIGRMPCVRARSYGSTTPSTMLAYSLVELRFTAAPCWSGR